MRAQKKKPPKRCCFRGFTPALLCGRKSRVLVHANYLPRILYRQGPVGVTVTTRPGTGTAVRRNHRRRRGSTSTPSAASRREAFTRSGAGGSLGVGSAGNGGPRILVRALRCPIFGSARPPVTDNPAFYPRALLSDMLALRKPGGREMIPLRCPGRGKSRVRTRLAAPEGRTRKVRCAADQVRRQRPVRDSR
jgi:hypothetical protein